MDAKIQVQGEAQVNRLQTWVVWGILASIALMVGLIGADIANQPAKIDGVVIFNRPPRGHDDSFHLTIDSLPPVGGLHRSQLQDCGVYLTPVAPERAIHSMEHGAVWITYQPELPQADIAYLQGIVRGQEYLLLSPFPGQRSPVVVTAWGVQLETPSVRDARIKQFIARYLLGPTTPERGAPCSGGLDGSQTMGMSPMRDFFDINFELLLFASGLVYFIVGLAVSLQSRRYSRLQLARSLGWLSVFGIAHGLHEWGLLFIPIQALYMNHLGISLLQLFQVTFLGTAFFALFAFGADLLQDKWPDLRLVPYLMALIWVIRIFALHMGSDWGMGWLQQQATIWAKYLLAFPGALLAAYGLRYQAERQIKALNLRPIYNTTLVASVTLVLYALLAGLFVPYGDFFPANWLNQSLLVRFTGIPQPVFLSLIGLVLAVTVTRVLEVFDLETGRLIEQMRLEQGLSAERDRIGRELHDGAIQMVYTAGLIVESARRRVEDDAVLSQRLDRAMTALNETVASLRANMNELRTESLTASLADGLRQRTQDPRLTTLMAVELSLDLPDTAAFNPAQTTHILAVVGEALTNAARHARPTCALVRATSENGHFVLSIRDDGSGFTPRPSDESGYGLRNMRDRARLLGGELSIESERGKGSCVTLRVPWEAI